MTKTWCVGGKVFSNTNKISQYEKETPRLQNLLKLSKELVVLAVVLKHKFLLSK